MRAGAHCCGSRARTGDKGRSRRGSRATSGLVPHIRSLAWISELVRMPVGSLRVRSVWYVLGVLVPPVIGAQTASPWTQDSIRSSVLQETRALRIALPVVYAQPSFADQRFPVLIVLDAQASVSFAAVVANARALAAPDTPAIPQMIIVGVETGRHRVRDMSPPPLDGPASRSDRPTGGAPRFAEFLISELLPYVAARYRTMDYTVVVGHSMTGLFAAYLYGHSPTAIDAVLAISPTLMWNGRVAYKQVLAGLRERSPVGRFFIAAGREETVEMDSLVRALAHDMENYDGPTAFEYQQLLEDTHSTAIVQGTINGLRFVFRPISLANAAIDRAARARNPSPAPAVVTAYVNIRQKYLEGARALGFPERMPHLFNLLWANSLVDNPEVVAAVPAICDDVVRYYPSLWQGHECLGRAWRQIGDLPRSENAFREALRLARQAGVPEGIRRAEEGLRSVARTP